MFTFLFYLGLGLIFLSGMMFSFTGVVSANILSEVIIEATEPALAIKPQFDENSHNNAILQAVYAMPVLVIGTILVIRNRK